MTNNRSVLLISLIALILLAFVPAVSANQILYDEEFYFRDNMNDIPTAFSHYVEKGSVVATDGVLKLRLNSYSDYPPPARWNWFVYPTAVEAPLEYTIHFKYKHEYPPRDNQGFMYIGLLSKDVNIQYMSNQDAIKYKIMAYPEISRDEWHTAKFVVLDNGEVWQDIDGNRTLITSNNTDFALHPFFGLRSWDYDWIELYVDYVEIMGVPAVDPTLRTGSVTMTDLNGTTISDFEVKAVNAFTGEVYTASTETDTAVITLPMDQTTTMPNPQTGEYEVTPIGYYRFFGYKPGYKMFVDTGIQVAVLPEKYRPYKFCDILVTTDTGNLRTGTVSMIDHNGTRISGFEVKAVNAYTGEVYTASTETDTAVITLPMDQTTTMPNPETGEYEETPIGYYRFFGYKPGYKMVYEDGIQIAVLPLKYRSYHFGDIIVTSESGYLTGKHQFQLRSLADNTILQTGTISAKSATTGEWYNGTVINGIATLILPYDTSIPTSKYAGNYYVYGSSPGYLDSEFPAQVTVTPDEQSRIHTIYLTPIGGIPDPGYVKLRIQAISETGQGIPNANIFIAGVEGAGWDFLESYTTSSTGYLEVSVPANTTYDISVSAPGYSASSRRIEVFDVDPAMIQIKLYLSGWPTQQPTTQPTGWPTGWPTTQPTPTSGIPGDDGSQGFLSEAIRGIGKVFGVGFATAKTILGMLLAIAIGFTTAKHLRGGAAEFGLGLLGGTMLGVLIGLLPVWTVVVLLLIVGMYIGYRYVGGGNNG